MSLGKISWRIGLVACTHKMTGNHAPHLESVIFEPLWNVECELSWFARATALDA